MASETRQKRNTRKRIGINVSKKSKSSDSDVEAKDLLMGMPAEDYLQFQPQVLDNLRAESLEVQVEQNVEKAMKVLKRKLIKEGLFRMLKARRYYEKPCEKRKRKAKESIKKIRKEEARRKKNQVLF